MPIPQQHEKAYKELEQKILKTQKIINKFLMEQKKNNIALTAKQLKAYKDKLDGLKHLQKEMANMQLNDQPPSTLITYLDKVIKSGPSGFAPDNLSNSPQERLFDEAERFITLIKKSYLNSDIWETYDKNYKDLMPHIKAFKAKEGGAKQAGKRTGVYTFEDRENNKAMMLIKQGDNVGETIAEYIGGQLYQLTIPDHAAKAFLVRDKTGHSINDVYVTSVYEKDSKEVKDAYEIAGLKERKGIVSELFSRAKRGIKKWFGFKEQSDFRKILRHDELEAGNSLGYSMANVLWHGDHDVHMGNFVHVEKNNGEKKFMKIDHGFSFFNFEDEVVDILGNPLRGKVLDFSIRRWAKGGKFMEAYPFNNFWSLAAERKRFYFSGPFIKGCEDIAELKEEDIRKNINQSLLDILNIYSPNSTAALLQFGERLGLSEEQLKGNKKPSFNESFTILKHIENHMVKQMKGRQQSMSKLADTCRAQAQKLTQGHHKLSRDIDQRIIHLLDYISDHQTMIKKYTKELSAYTKPEQHARTQREITLLMNQQLACKSEIEFLKMLEQANDLGYLALNQQTQELEITDSFNFHNEGKKVKIKPEDFDLKMSQVMLLSEAGDLRSKETTKVLTNKIPISDITASLIENIKVRLPELKESEALKASQSNTKDRKPSQ